MKKIRENRWRAIISSILILLPMLAGVLFWSRLPSEMPIHFGLSGEADRFVSKLFCVTALPLILLVIHWFSILETCLDRGNRDQSKKVMGLIFWISPVTSISLGALIYSSALGREIDPELFTPVLIGVMFIVLGNYLPKIKQNYTLGIKLPWTVASEENWNMTHRFGGTVWVVSGFVILLSMLLPGDAFITALFASVLVAAVFPTAYSYMIYRKEKKRRETEDKER